ncbi:hypothetical protein [Tenacibaculum sp. nBUS_03]|uniref:hypothetical protein n=1 Tax=Tenacibaculum sp. nBUS_03 TaxID=3395320 RepID=UPI003EBA428B
MKIKLFIILLLLAFFKAEITHSQNDTIRGEIFSSINRKKAIVKIHIFEKGTSNRTIANKNAEMKDETTNWYVTTSEVRNLIWNGLKLVPDDYNKKN